MRIMQAFREWCWEQMGKDAGPPPRVALSEGKYDDGATILCVVQCPADESPLVSLHSIYIPDVEREVASEFLKHQRQIHVETMEQATAVIEALKKVFDL